MFEIKGKVALITGGTQGIGLAIAKQLLQKEAKGVALIGRNTEHGELAVEQISKEFSDTCVIYINADVSSRSQFEDAFEKTIETFKQLDILVNNAGVVQEIEWEKCITTNLQGCVTGSLLALDKYFPCTSSSSEKIILNVSSVLGLVPAEMLPVYSATKYGIIAFSKSISGPNRCPSLHVKVLVICPHLTLTSMAKTERHQLHEKLYEPFNLLVSAAPPQTSDELAQHAVAIMQNGKSGSIWTITGNNSKEIQLPSVFELPKV